MDQQEPIRRRRCDRYTEPAAEPVTAQPQTAQQPPAERVTMQPQTASQPSVQRVRPPCHPPERETHRFTQAPQYPMRPQAQRTQPPVGIERHTPVKKSLESPPPPSGQRAPRKKEWYPSGVQITCLVVVALLCLSCVAGIMLMNAWLKQQSDEREAAHTRLIANHPVQYEACIEKYAAEYNLQPAFVTAIILNESSFNSHAESGVGARGLMQLMPETGEWIAHKLGMDSVWDADLLWDPETNIRFGCWYLNYLSGLFNGDPVTVASAYHTGQGQVKTWLQNETYAPDGKALSLESMPDGPTKTYAGRVTRDYGIYDKLRFHAFNP